MGRRELITMYNGMTGASNIFHHPSQVIARSCARARTAFERMGGGDRNEDLHCGEATRLGRGWGKSERGMDPTFFMPADGTLGARRRGGQVGGIKSLRTPDGSLALDPRASPNPAESIRISLGKCKQLSARPLQVSNPNTSFLEIPVNPWSSPTVNSIYTLLVIV